jgi:hypothetical protein
MFENHPPDLSLQERDSLIAPSVQVRGKVSGFLRVLRASVVKILAV